MKSKYLAEFLGTAFLFWAVVGSGIMGQNLNQNDAVTLLANTFATVFALYFLITCLGDYSSHFNPIVSLVMRLRGEISTNTFFVFSIPARKRVSTVIVIGVVIGIVILSMAVMVPV